MDCFGDHAAMCACKGDRTIRHNKLRNLIHDQTQKAGMRTVKEKPGLLPSRPLEDGVAGTGLRRPADIWWGEGAGGNGVAYDLAVTSGMRRDWLHKGASRAGVFLESMSSSSWNIRRRGGSAGSRGLNSGHWSSRLMAEDGVRRWGKFCNWLEGGDGKCG